MNIILYQPQIPQNTGNIVRTCKVAGAKLYLVKPLGFSISDRAVKRAGLDYWNDIFISTIDDLESFLESATAPFYFFSSKAEKTFSDAAFTRESLLIFGSETAGLPDRFRKRWPDAFLKIPMMHGERCLNLSNAVAVALYEAWRQQSYQFLM